MLKFTVDNVLLLIFLVVFFSKPMDVVHADTNFTISGNFSCNDVFEKNMVCVGDAATSQGNLLILPRENKNAPYSRGIALYHQQIRIFDSLSRQAASFGTTFKMKIDIRNIAGDGLAFCMINEQRLGGKGGVLALYDLDTGRNISAGGTLAVEFDTHFNPEFDDISDNHVGVDTETIRSVVSVNASDVGIRLGDGNTTFVWIDYNGTTHNLEVRISHSSDPRPLESFVSYAIDLSTISTGEYMWVGFSSASGGGVATYDIDDWRFASFGLPLPPKAKGKTSPALIVGIMVAIPTLLGLGVLLLFLLSRRRRSALQKAASEDAERAWQMETSATSTYTYRQLSVATNGFSEQSKLGEGGFGTVYRGVLPSNGTLVAIKKIADESKQGIREFLAEVSIITQLRHRNIVQLLGCCRNDDKLLLVYELMPNGSLDRALFLKRKEEPGNLLVLSWSQRFRIVSGLAAALHYLHEGWNQQVIHRDVKSSNIMLDSEFNAKLGDFGLARMVDHQKSSAATQLAGTYGYIAPESVADGKFTVKTDVYAFGAVALEIACGRRAFDSSYGEDELRLVDWVWSLLSQGNLLLSADEELKGSFEESEVAIVLGLGLLCSHPDPTCRPSMRQVTQILSGDAPMLPVPSSKPLATYSNDSTDLYLKALLNASRKSSSSKSGSTSNLSAIFSSTGSSSRSYLAKL